MDHDISFFNPYIIFFNGSPPLISNQIISQHWFMFPHSANNKQHSVTVRDITISIMGLCSFLKNVGRIQPSGILPSNKRKLKWTQSDRNFLHNFSQSTFNQPWTVNLERWTNIVSSKPLSRRWTCSSCGGWTLPDKPQTSSDILEPTRGQMVPWYTLH